MYFLLCIHYYFLFIIDWVPGLSFRKLKIFASFIEIFWLKPSMCIVNQFMSTINIPTINKRIYAFAYMYKVYPTHFIWRLCFLSFNNTADVPFIMCRRLDIGMFIGIYNEWKLFHTWKKKRKKNCHTISQTTISGFHVKLNQFS